MLDSEISSDKKEQELLKKLSNYYQEEKSTADESEYNVDDAFNIFEQLGKMRYGEQIKSVLTNRTECHNEEQELIITRKSNLGSWMSLDK